MAFGNQPTDEWVMINLEVLNINDESKGVHVAHPSHVSTPENNCQLPSSLSTIVQALNSPSIEQHMQAVMRVRKLLSVEIDPPIQEVINAGICPRLIESLTTADIPGLQFEAAWALTNIASGSSEHTQFLVQQGVIPIFVRLLASPNSDVQEQAVWALGNIAGDTPETRDLCLQHGALQAVCQILVSPSGKLATQRQAVWALSNMLRGKPAPAAEHQLSVLPLLVGMLNNDDEEILSDALWALSYISDGTNDMIQAALQAGVLPPLVRRLQHPSREVHTPALRAVGNIATGDDEQTSALLQQNVLPVLSSLLGSEKPALRKEVWWTLSNIAAGTSAQVQLLADHGVFQQLVSCAHGETNLELFREIVWTLGNALSSADQRLIASLVLQHHCLPVLARGLASDDARVVVVALEGIENVLKAGEDLKAGEATQTMHEGNPFHAELNRVGAAQAVQAAAAASSDRYVQEMCTRIMSLA